MASCVLEVEIDNLRIDRRRVQGIVADSTCYYYTAPTPAEAHYLCALLNSQYVNQQIKAHQPEGLWGARHIQRTPFEACAIPMFKADDADHQALARLSLQAHQKIEDNKTMTESKLLNGGPAYARRLARENTAAEIEAIDEIARRVIAE